MTRATITGWGMCVPPTVLGNADLERFTETSDEWITTRSGIKERRISHVPMSDLATVAGARALAAAGRDAADVDLLILATCSGDTVIPSAASFVQAKLGLVNAAAYDINAACSGWIYGVEQAGALIAAGVKSTVLVIGAERLSRFLDFTDRSTAVLFADGAGATLLEPSDAGDGLAATETGIDGEAAELLWVPDVGTNTAPGCATPEGSGVRMNGREVFKRAVTMMGDASIRVLEEAGWSVDDVDLFIPHQANIRIIDAVARRLGIEDDRIFTNIHAYGNTSAATIPMAITEAVAAGRIGPGSKLVFAAFGGGLTWGAAAVQWGSRTEPIATSEASLSPTTETVDDLLAPNLEYFGWGR
ncbi:MAG: beta-ketoacyl-ACP synthase III [Acidimicrobiia bacterium]